MRLSWLGITEAAKVEEAIGRSRRLISDYSKKVSASERLLWNSCKSHPCLSFWLQHIPANSGFSFDLAFQILFSASPWLMQFWNFTRKGILGNVVYPYFWIYIKNRCSDFEFTSDTSGHHQLTHMHKHNTEWGGREGETGHLVVNSFIRSRSKRKIALLCPFFLPCFFAEGSGLIQMRNYNIPNR